MVMVVVMEVLMLPWSACMSIGNMHLSALVRYNTTATRHKKQLGAISTATARTSVAFSAANALNIILQKLDNK